MRGRNYMNVQDERYFFETIEHGSDKNKTYQGSEKTEEENKAILYQDTLQRKIERIRCIFVIKITCLYWII